METETIFPKTSVDTRVIRLKMKCNLSHFFRRKYIASGINILINTRKTFIKTPLFFHGIVKSF